MNIVIIGEFSGLSKNLSDGFYQNGHECFIFSYGDGYKKISLGHKGHIIKSYNSKFGKLLFGTLEKYKLRKYVRKLSKTQLFDVVIVLNPSFLKRKFFFWDTRFTEKMIMRLVKDPAQIYMLACGNDIVFYDYWIHKKTRSYDMIKLCEKQFTHPIQKLLHKEYSKFIHKIIPTTFDYAQAWRCSCYAKGFRVFPMIPMPVNLDNFKVANSIEEKIVVFHGLNRPLFKGTSYIAEAMNRLEKEYPDKVVCIIKGNLPYVEYVKILEKTNIVIDQVYGFSPGMNALFSMAMGKVVLGGNGDGFKKEMRTPDIPIIDICPDSNFIFNELEKLILNPSLILELSLKSRLYIEQYHDSRKVAKSYLDIFESE